MQGSSSWKLPVDSRGTKTLLSVTGFASQYIRNKGIVMSLPISVGSITTAVLQAVIASLQQLLGDRLSTAASIRERHGKDASYHPCVPPFPALDSGGRAINESCG
jgi:hypothetical protein